MLKVASYLCGSLARAPLLLSRRPLLPVSSHLCRFSTNHIDVSYDSGKGIATVCMKRPPVNSFTLEFLTDMSIVLDKLHNDKRCRALVLTSAVPKTFSAGLDFSELYQCKRERAAQFYESFQEVIMRLYSSRLVTIAAINGHCIAGAYVIAMTCDYRIMANGPFKIGLNETHLGMTLPLWIMSLLANITGTRMAERASQLGLLFSPEEAKAANLVDQLADDSQMMQLVDSELEKWLKIPDAARQLTKGNFRQPLAELMAAKKKDDAEAFVSNFMRDSMQRFLGSYIEQMKSKKSKK